MTRETPYISRYERRVKLAQDAVQSRTTLDDKAAFDLAVHLVHVLDTVPEKTR
ncbi:hypothetical protein ATK36_4467 [Amycolatopsis sulphurea]|uniref:Uncharacterized protein n=1 Tax=Amycolatopsis sulphurea TaxID=76022 RepID=A0A2A9FEZ7_9PSEU|nr:DUF6307 family protein [Amycolatopsis sulphurea]PFG49321.1 hypothetical protein ATK36_4467 [Amycolatopsis sulphurea]